MVEAMTDVGGRRVSRGVLVVSLVVVLGMLRGTSDAQQEEVAEAGKLSYRHYCAVCHGLNGKGTGEMAKVLKVKPADLTQLSAKTYGIFPFWDVYRAIDGRKEMWGHGPRDMPIWGTVLKQEATPDIGADLQAYARLLEIVYYIESLQAPARRAR
jgi:mono/diheme cytochrome c family protein